MQELCALLSKLLRKHINEHFDGNLTAASKMTGIPYRFARETYLGESKSASFMYCLQIFQLTNHNGDSVLKENFPVEYAIHSKALAGSSQPMHLDGLEVALESPRKGELLAFILTGSKSQEEVVKYFGQPGLIWIGEFVQLKLVTVDENGTIASSIGKDIVITPQTSMKAVKAIVYSIDPLLPASDCGIFWGSFNRQGLQKAYDLVFEFRRTMSNLAENPELRGSTPFVGAVAGGPMALVYGEEKKNV